MAPGPARGCRVPSRLPASPARTRSPPRISASVPAASRYASPTWASIRDVRPGAADLPLSPGAERCTMSGLAPRRSAPPARCCASEEPLPISRLARAPALAPPPALQESSCPHVLRDHHNQWPARRLRRERWGRPGRPAHPRQLVVGPVLPAPAGERARRTPPPGGDRPARPRPLAARGRPRRPGASGVGRHCAGGRGRPGA